jgi:hypothetical protein
MPTANTIKTAPEATRIVTRSAASDEGAAIGAGVVGVLGATDGLGVLPVLDSCFTYTVPVSSTRNLRPVGAASRAAPISVPLVAPIFFFVAAISAAETSFAKKIYTSTVYRNALVVCSNIRLSVEDKGTILTTMFSKGISYCCDKTIEIAFSTSVDVAFCGNISVISKLNTTTLFDIGKHPPSVLLTKPPTQGSTQAVDPMSLVIPGKHVQLALPLPDVEFTPHCMQVDMPAFGAYVFASQSAHGRFEENVLYLPGWHTMHMSDNTSRQIQAKSKQRRIFFIPNAFI